MCSIIDRLIKVILLIVLFAPVVACSDEEPVVEPVPQPETGLRFGIKQQPGSRVVNDGLSANFVDGDSIGCVIAFRNGNGGFDYQCTTSWKYNKSNGMLVLDHYYHENGDHKCWYSDAVAPAEPEKSDDVIFRHPDYKKEDGYVYLNKAGKEYCFFFYYPFINNADVDRAFGDLRELKDAYKIQVPFSGFVLELNPDWDDWNKAENKKKLTVIGFPDREHYAECITDGRTEKHPHFKWTEYPCFASIAQSSLPQLDNSNFMWVRYVWDQKVSSKPITQEDKTTHYTVDLVFRKKMAAIDLVVDDDALIQAIEKDITKLYYTNIPEGKDGNYWSTAQNVAENYIIIGKRFDLSTGLFTDYPQYREDWQCQNNGINKAENSSVKASHISDAYVYKNNGTKSIYNRVRPCPMGGGVYRVILPPQESFKCELHFPDKIGNDKVINLYPKIPVLKENTLYTIRLQSVDEWEIIINDWQKGQGMLIEEDK